ncbi:MAG: ASCH domain-containing protein [Acidobacteria bacterium]|nr:ASCH domain-containing protein [Acidobacteriota bacterium]
MFPRVDGLRSIEFGTPGASREHLVGLVLHGGKRATAGLLSEYEREGEPVEHEGELLAMVDNRGRHVGTLEVTRVEVLRFADVPDEFAVAEAEGDLDAADFRASHLAFWTGVGEHVTDDTPVVTVHFDLLPEIIRTLDR